ncbi:MAG: hypothetical protein U0269_34390 [Polyangiales bacterium]
MNATALSIGAALFAALGVACSPTMPSNPDGSSSPDATANNDGAVTPGEDGSMMTGDGSSNPCASGSCPAVAQLALSQDYSCARIQDGTLRCWGRNLAGQLGDGTMTDHPRPVVSMPSNLVHVSTGYEHACAVRMDGTVWCWGAGSNGQLGNGAMDASATPVQVMGITNATKVVAGQYASCALLADRGVRCWGRGTDLGANTLANSAVPVVTMNLTDATDLTMGFTATRSGNSQTACALRMNGSIRCWGYGNEGQIGDGTRNSARVPTDVMGITNARAVVAGGSHVCALLADNTVRCWGDGISGQLGDGTQEIRSTPVPVTGLSNVRSLALGDRFSCAVLMDGTAQCWGEGGRAQLGRGMIPPVGMNRFPTPAPVVGLSNIVAMGAGEEHACAFTMDGVTRCWGDNSFGQLGDGNATTLERFPTPLAVQW